MRVEAAMRAGVGRGSLAGLYVLELSEDTAAPFCARMLADAGADVIKAEPPAGDPARRWQVRAGITAEMLGLARRKEGFLLWQEGHAAPGGRLPINTNGGGLSFNHSMMAPTSGGWASDDRRGLFAGREYDLAVPAAGPAFAATTLSHPPAANWSEPLGSRSPTHVVRRAALDHA